MAALLVLLGLLGGFATPVAIAAITPIQWALIGVNAADYARRLPKEAQQLRAFLESPQFRAWAAANGERAILLRPGEVTER